MRAIVARRPHGDGAVIARGEKPLVWQERKTIDGARVLAEGAGLRFPSTPELYVPSFGAQRKHVSGWGDRSTSNPQALV